MDSSVGGKVGVNLAAGKNLVGAFHQPRFVLCDLTTLDTLPRREFQAGLGEVIKYGIIFDASLFRKLEQRLESLLEKHEETLAAVIGRCCSIKANIVGQDERESGLRAILNFGHTIGHALENISGYGRFLHGEAISLGQVAAAAISSAVLGFPQADVERIRTLFARSGLPTAITLSRSQSQTSRGDAPRQEGKRGRNPVRFSQEDRSGRVWASRPASRRAASPRIRVATRRDFGGASIRSAREIAMTHPEENDEEHDPQNQASGDQLLFDRQQGLDLHPFDFLTDSRFVRLHSNNVKVGVDHVERRPRALF